MVLDNKTKVYIAGCGGMLGKSVYSVFNEKCIVKATDIDLNEEWLEFADVRDIKGLENSIKEFGPDMIINLSALTSLEYCELNVENAWKTNALGQENICLIAKEIKATVVYISTAGIFDGNQEFYSDFDQPNPLGIYAKSKYYGEEITQKIIDNYFIFRAGWMMGGGPDKDKKFINKIYKQISDGAKELYVVDDKLGTPTYTKSFAEGIFKVVSTGYIGLYNQVCNGDCSRYDVAKEFIDFLGLKNKITLTKVNSEYFQDEYFAPRPFSEKLVNLKLTSRGINFMPHWKEALEEYSKEYK